MATTIVTPAASTEPSMSELRAMFAEPVPVSHAKPAEAAPAASETTPETPEATSEPKDTPARDASGKFVKAAGTTEAESGTAQVQDPETPVEEKEEPLPPAVQKRIAKEVEKQARIDREIAETVSRTKARQAELDKLKADTSGTEPAKNTAPAKVEGKPVRPVKPPKPEYGVEGQTFADYEKAIEKREADHDAALSAYETENEAWLLAEAEKAADKRVAERQFQERFQRTVAEAEKAHGKGFDGLRQRIVDNTPEGLQIEIGTLEDWPSIVAHLGNPKNEAEMTALADMYGRSPSAAIRELGRIEDRLKKPDSTVSTPATTPRLSPPPVRAGGSASATPTIDMEKAPMDVFKREMAKLMGR